MSLTLADAALRAPDRLVALAAAAIRPLRYVADGRPPAGPPIAGLRVEVADRERALWHGSTGVYGFLRLPPGPHRVLVTDPAGRFLPAAFRLTVPDRAALRARLERGVAPAAMTPAAPLREVALHEASGHPRETGVTTLHGLVRDATRGNRTVPLARIAVTALVGGALRSVVTFSGPDGSWLLRLPGERPDSIGGDPPWAVARALAVRAPVVPLRRALAADFLAALPEELDTAATGPSWLARDHNLPSVAAGTNPPIPFEGGRQLRRDILLV
ncbi:MAG: hypothetical protein MUF65_07840 [Rubritepida sp.]|jgi:hypothetical protein|nr:hypothetical protein [Rubritepida sp.]